MPTYAHRCPRCGPFDAVRPMVRSDEPAPCPLCAAVGPRVVSAPALRGVAPGYVRARDAAERSADAPGVVSAAPPARRRTPPRDPRHAALPRP